jgi:thioredoxin
VSGAGVLELTDEGWERDVLQATLPVLVDFGAPWCTPCERMEPIVADLAVRHAGRLVVGWLDVDRHPGPGVRYDVLSLPTLILFKDGRPAARLAGLVPAERVDAAVASHLPARAA